MKHEKTRILGALLVIILWMVLAVAAWIKPAEAHSVAERRKLTQAPAFTTERFVSGQFAKCFEKYTLDQFPMRDSFRQIKSMFSYYGLFQSDNNNIYVQGGYVEKLNYPLNADAVEKAKETFTQVYEKYIQGKTENIYVAVVPDKGYYLTKENGFPAMDYAGLMDQMELNWAQTVDLTQSLSKDSYYRTDTHWRQEALIPVAQKLSEAMGQTGPAAGNYIVQTMDRPFYGVYYGQAALPMQPDEMKLLQSDVFRDVKVTGYDDLGRPVELPMYDLEAGDDLYDVFFNGSKQSLVVMENPNARTDKHLVIFRDSYGCSIAPLFLEDYAKITLVDLRASQTIPMMVSYRDADVLFLQSTLVLNNPDSYRIWSNE